MEMIMSMTWTADAHRDTTPGGLLRAAAAVRRWWMARMARRLERLAAEQLSSMSDRELKDIGIARSRIDFAARRESDAALGRWF